MRAVDWDKMGIRTHTNSPALFGGWTRPPSWAFGMQHPGGSNILQPSSHGLNYSFMIKSGGPLAPHPPSDAIGQQTLTFQNRSWYQGRSDMITCRNKAFYKVRFLKYA
eukprot:206071-Pleurochrysis_carterae.AAC.1